MSRSDTDDPRYRTLLARRVPRSEIEPGVAYHIHARNGGVGVAVMAGNNLGYILRREKYNGMSCEWDWSEGAPHGTVIPLRRIDEAPPAGDYEEVLLRSLADQEEACRAETAAAWEEVIGPTSAAWRRWRERRLNKRGRQRPR